MEINELLNLGKEKLKNLEYGNPELESRILLEKLMDVDYLYISLNLREKVDKKIEDSFLALLEKRAGGYPFQYLINEAEFMGLNFYVEEGVLIPRQDTEILVEYLNRYIGEKDRELNFLELGIGSGAIILSLAHYNKNISAYGIDIEDTPIKVSKINKESLGLENVKILQGDLFDPLGENYKEYFQIICSNPPYIEEDEIPKLQREVKDFEPMEALVGGEDGLDFYRKISNQASYYLGKEGLLIFEIGYNQGQVVKDIMAKDGYENIEVLKDYQGLDRVVLGFKKEE